MEAKFPMTLMYDMTLKKVGCALIQASCGATIDNFSLQMMDCNNWFLAPTKDMKMYSVKSQEELNKVIEITKNGK